jgi:hypothetical protein
VKPQGQPQLCSPCNHIREKNKQQNNNSKQHHQFSSAHKNIPNIKRQVILFYEA